MYKYKQQGQLHRPSSQPFLGVHVGISLYVSADILGHPCCWPNMLKTKIPIACGCAMARSNLPFFVAFNVLLPTKIVLVKYSCVLSNQSRPKCNQQQQQQQQRMRRWWRNNIKYAAHHPAPIGTSWDSSSTFHFSRINGNGRTIPKELSPPTTQRTTRN